jgi:hypothetical protein
MGESVLSSATIESAAAAGTKLIDSVLAEATAAAASLDCVDIVGVLAVCAAVQIMRSGLNDRQRAFLVARTTEFIGQTCAKIAAEQTAQPATKRR